jgi:hypothetical protein
MLRYRRGLAEETIPHARNRATPAVEGPRATRWEEAQQIMQKLGYRQDKRLAVKVSARDLPFFSGKPSKIFAFFVSLLVIPAKVGMQNPKSTACPGPPHSRRFCGGDDYLLIQRTLFLVGL